MATAKACKACARVRGFACAVRLTTESDLGDVTRIQDPLQAAARCGSRKRSRRRDGHELKVAGSLQQPMNRHARHSAGLHYLSDSKKSHGVRCLGHVGEASARSVVIAGAIGLERGRMACDLQTGMTWATSINPH